MRKIHKKLTLTSETVARLTLEPSQFVLGAGKPTLYNGCTIETAAYACACTLLESSCATLP